LSSVGFIVADISIGMIAGFTVGGFIGAFLPNPIQFLPQRLQDRHLLRAGFGASFFGKS